MGIGTHTLPNKGFTDTWLTPLGIIDALGPFDLDPCAQPNHKTANNLFTEYGLERKWEGRVWLNPPYSEVGLWLEKLADHENGVALVFARMETKWAQKILPKTTSVFFPAGRIFFLTPKLERKGNAGGPSMFLAFGPVPDWSKLGPGLICTLNNQHRN